MKKNSVIALATLSCLLASAQNVILTGTIYFDSNKYVVKPAEQQKLSALLQQVKSDHLEINITGHTDALGSNIFNDTLSERRTQAVENCLRNLLKASTDYKFMDGYFGKRKPVANNDAESRRQLNRRVEVTISYAIPAPAPPVALTTTTPIANSHDSISWFYKELKDNYASDSFSFTSHKLVSTKSNALLLFPSSGKASIQEASTEANMLALNLSTTSNSFPIATEGMYFINITSGAEKATGKKLIIIKPVGDTATKVFNGQHTSNGGLDWNAPTAPVLAQVRGKDLIKFLKTNNGNITWIKRRRFHINIGGKSFQFGRVIYDGYSNGQQAKTDSLRQIFKSRSIENIDKSIQADVSYAIFEYIIPEKYMSINCDFFPRFNTPLVNYVAEIKPAGNTDVKLLFDKYKVVYPGRPVGDKFVFDHVAKGLKARMVVIKYSDNKPYMAVKEVIMGGEKATADKLDFTAYETMNSFKDALAKLNQ